MADFHSVVWLTTEDRKRYSSFIATTNERHPLCDPTGSRRFLCIEIPSGEFIDNGSPIDYAQLYAQILHELSLVGTRYWFTREEESRIQDLNMPFMKTEDIDEMIAASFDLEKSETEGQWMSGNEVISVLCRNYSQLKSDSGLKLGSAELIFCQNHGVADIAPTIDLGQQHVPYFDKSMTKFSQELHHVFDEVAHSRPASCCLRELGSYVVGSMRKTLNAR